jgi:hypothetical protein
MVVRKDPGLGQGKASSWGFMWLMASLLLLPV